MINLTHRRPQSGHFSQNWDIFFQFMKKGQVDFPPPSSSYAPEKTKGYLLKVVRLKGLKFSGGIEMELWGKMG